MRHLLRHLSLIKRVNKVSDDAYFTVMDESGRHRDLPDTVSEEDIRNLFICAELFPQYAVNVMNCRGSIKFILENTPEVVEKELLEYEALVARCRRDYDTQAKNH